MLPHASSCDTRRWNAGVVAFLLSLGVLWVPWAAASPDPDERSADKRATDGDDGGGEPGNLRLVQAGRSDDDPPRRTQPPTTDQRKAMKRRASSPSQPDPRRRTPTPRGRPQRPSARKGEPVTTSLNLELENMGKPPEERTYTFSIVDGTYKDLVENFGRMAGLGVLGEAPAGTVTFISTETMDFQSALTRVRLLLFKFSPIEPYWLQYQGDHLEVIRVTDIWRDIEIDHLFMDVASFEESDIDDEDLAMLLYTPRDTSVSDFTLLRDFMPDYVRIAPMEDTNSLAIFALVKDIRKYLELIRLFEGAGADPRVLQKIPVHHLAASQAVETLRVLMDELDEAGKPRPRRGRGAEQAIDLPGQRTILFPDDAQEVIVVRAVPRQIEEIKKMLEFIDIDLGVEVDPVLIPIEYVSVGELVAIIRPLVAAGEVTSTPDTSKAGGQNRPKSRRPSRARAEAVKSDGLMLMPVERTNTLVVLGSNEQVADVRRFVDLFDVPNPADRPVFVDLVHVTPDYIAGIVPQIVGAGEGGAGQLKVIGNAVDDTVILIGSSQDVDAARDLIATLDVPGEEVRLHSYRFENASPSAVMELVAMVDAQEAAPAAPAGKGAPRRPVRSRAAKGSNLHVDEAAMTMYVLCTDQGWAEQYLPLLKRLDEEAAEPTPFARIELSHADPDELIGVLTPLVAGKPRRSGAQPKLIAATDAIIVTDATPAELAHVRALVGELDQPADGRELRLFEIEYADPTQLQAILQSGVIGGGPQARRPRAKGAAPAGVAAPVITVLDETLVVSALPDDMEEIADLIAQLDVEGRDDTVLRVYSIPKGLDVDNVASLLESLVHESPTVARRRGAQPAAAAGGENVRIVSQTVSRRLFISAPVGLFAKIEETLSLLLEGDAPEEFRVEFIDVQYNSAETIAALIEPILQNREKELIAIGEIAEDVDPTNPKKRRRNPLAASVVTMTPDADGGRLMVTGPSAIVAEARVLVEQLDRPDSHGDRVMRVITLTRTQPDEIVDVVGAMLKREAGKSGSRPPRPRVRRAGAKDESKVISQTAEDVTIVAAPGGGAVIISGYPEDVDEVERWIRRLDEDAKPEKTLKIYRIQRADLDRLAESILALCDDAGSGPRAAAKARLQQQEEFDLFEATSGIRRGNEITLSLDYFSRIIVARASPAKMYEIDTVVAMYEGTEDGEEPIFEEGGPIPFLIFELQNADAFDASIQLENLLETLWPYGADAPEVDYISGTDQLVVKCLPEHNSFIEDIIAQYIDKETTKTVETKRVFKTVTGITASQLAMQLKMAMPTIQVDVERIGEEIPPMEQVRPYRPQPCVLPESLSCVIQGACAAPLGQSDEKPAASEEPQDEPVTRESVEQEPAEPEKAETAEKMMDALLGEGADEPVAEAPAQPESGETEQLVEEPIIVRFDDRAGMLVIEGSPRDVDEVEDVLDDLLDEIEEISHKPDIRVFRIKYRDVNVAANILESMFGSGRNVQQIGGARAGAAGAAQMRRMQAMQQQMQRMRQQMVRQQQTGQQPAEPTPQIDPRTGLPIKPEEEEEGKKGPGEIRVLPDPQTRTLIIRAATEDFPIIVELLATIDRPPDFESKHKIFKLAKLRATDVEEQLKVLLGISQQSSRPSPIRRPTTRRGVRGRPGQQNAALQQIEDALLNLNLGATGEGAINAAADIVITSNEQANTLLVMAPVAALDLVEELIKELEAQDIPSLETRMYVMRNADAADVGAQLKEIFGARGAGKSAEEFDPMAVNQATFVAEPRTNTLIVRALGPDFEKIEPLIDELDRDLGDQETVITFVLTNADAQNVASTMSQAYGASRGRGGGQPLKFVGDTAGNTVLVVAPEHLREEITLRIKELDRLAGETGQPKAVQLTAGSAEDIAKKLQDIYSRGRRGGDIRVVGDEKTKQIFISAPNALLPRIEEFARSMDTPTLDVSVKTFPLKYAKALEVHEKLMDMVRQASMQIRNKSAFGVFTAVPDERTNSIVVLGSPEAFAMVQNALSQIDISPTEQEQIVTAIYHLTNADATELARNITTVYREKRGRSAETLTAEANRTNNSIIVRGPKAQVDEVYAQMIKPLEEQAAGIQRAREIVTLEHGQAVEVARTINDELNKARAGQRREGQEPLAVIANESLNSIVISGPQAEVDEFVTLARSLDQEPPITKERVTRVYNIKFAEPNSLVDTLKNIYRSQRGQRPEEAVDLGYDWATSKLVVTALPDTHEEIAQMLADVDIESTTVRTEHVVMLEYANAQDLGRNLGSMFSQKRGQRGQQAVNIVGDIGTNSLIVYANEDEFNRIAAIVEQLDVRPVDAQNREIKSFTLANTNPWIIADALKQIYTPRGRQANPRDEVVAIPEGTTMSVIVSASKERMEEIQAIVDEFDKPGATDSDVHVVEVKHADGASVAQSLQQIFVQTGGRDVRGQATVQISNPRGTNMVVIKANDQKFQQILETIQDLDTASGELGEIEVIALQHIEAELMQETLQEYLRKSGQQGRGAELVGDVRLTANPQNNTLVIAGEAEQVARLRDVIAKLDVEVEGAGNAPRIIELKNARAAQIEPVLTQMFVEGGRQARGGRGGGGASIMTPVIAADEMSNTLIVRASPTDFNMIEDLIGNLDVKAADEESAFMLIPVAEGVNVIDLAELVETTINEGERIRAERYPGMEPGTLVVTPDVRSNLLVLSGTTPLFEDAQRLTESVVAMGPTGRLSSRFIKIENRSPEEIKRLLDTIIEENTRSQSGTKSKASSRRPSSSSRSSGSSRRPSSRGSSSRRR